MDKENIQSPIIASKSRKHFEKAFSIPKVYVDLYQEIGVQIEATKKSNSKRKVWQSLPKDLTASEIPLAFKSKFLRSEIIVRRLKMQQEDKSSLRKEVKTKLEEAFDNVLKTSRNLLSQLGGRNNSNKERQTDVEKADDILTKSLKTWLKWISKVETYFRNFE